MSHRQATRSEAELHPLERAVLTYLSRRGIELKKDSHVLVAVSGGPDSIALLLVLIALKKLLHISRYGIVHFNHRLRKEADEDENFVRKLASNFGIDFYSGSEDVKEYALKRKISIEMAARECRYRFFFHIKAELKADYLALGHTGSDQAEEILLRLIRGTGPDGFSGMPVLSKKGLFRPLLGVFRSDIISYLNEMKATYRTDESNFSLRFQRNRIRHEVFPLLDKISGRSVERIICRTAELFTEDAIFINDIVEQAWNEISLFSARDRQWIWDRKKFCENKVGLQRRIIRKLFGEIKGDLYSLSFEQVENLRRFILEGHSGKKLELHGISALIEGNFVRFSDEISEKKPFPGDRQIIPSPGRYEIKSTGGQLILTLISQSEAKQIVARGNEAEVVFDADKISWPMVLRFWQPGDRFQPLGMRGRSKKVQDFFTDRKIPLSRRHRIPILCDQEKICWIAGMRADERTRITESTKRFLLARYTET
ncbi:tRNA lysidine(34) synthetase TilS [Thermodesulforhabdus norvegica]|uniref:tRNA(Ile)-lysidine synthase n=1 Tax=Thermodesulforhabdus norvegica TaxID=39841 RepID=A0A1I4UJ47_9BACT|nr:tRNA lysidine(34) synthetase TilS [Thermodesulforhabdus norvegica]SFM89032.1 tRNA(Ile)-lysidine synthase [Thermodesulforhabdus norvegica]